MINVTYGNTSLTAAQTQYQSAGRSKKSSGNSDFGTQLRNGEYYINVPRNEDVCDWPTFPEVDKIPSKYALKDGKMLGKWWRNPGAEYRFFHAAESTDENPVLVARGVDEDGKFFEEKIDIRQIDLYNATPLEIDALSQVNHLMLCTPSITDDWRLLERADFMTEYQKDLRARRRLNLKQEAAWMQEDLDFMLGITSTGTKSSQIGSAYTVDAGELADLSRENERNLELYSIAARERMASVLARQCSDELSDWLWEK